MSSSLESRFHSSISAGAQGIVDPHVHLIQAGLHLQRLQLQDSSITSQDIFTERVRQHSRQLGPDEWVLGGGWDDNQWGGVLPDASWIDEVRQHQGRCGCSNASVQDAVLWVLSHRAASVCVSKGVEGITWKACTPLLDLSWAHVRTYIAHPARTTCTQAPSHAGRLVPDLHRSPAVSLHVLLPHRSQEAGLRACHAWMAT